MILQNSTPEDPEYKNFKGKKKKITCLLEIRQVYSIVEQLQYRNKG